MNEVSKLEPRSVEPAQSNDPMLTLIERIAVNPDVPMERMGQIMDMRERQMAKAAEQTFNRAFAAALAEMPDVPRSGQNNHTRQSYSTLDDLIRTVRPILSRHGLALNWITGIDGNFISVTAVVRHADGHQITSTQVGERDSGKAMNKLQGGGSTETYLKRYTGFGILGLSSGDERDDDGRSAGRSAPTISADQFGRIKALIERKGADLEKFLAWVGCENLEELPVAKFAPAIAQLEKKADAQ